MLLIESQIQVDNREVSAAEVPHYMAWARPSYDREDVNIAGDLDLMEFLYHGERVYSTTSDGRGFANGGSQGAEGDRRAAIRGANATGAGGL